MYYLRLNKRTKNKNEKKTVGEISRYMQKCIDYHWRRRRVVEFLQFAAKIQYEISHHSKFSSNSAFIIIQKNKKNISFV